MSEEDVEVEVAAEVEAPEVQQPSESETKARRLGWVPKDEYKGDQSKWRDADEFLKRGEEIHGFLKADLEKLHATISDRDREIAEIRRAMDDFRKFHNETEARAYKRAISELKQLKATAIEQGDGAKVVELDEQIDQLKDAQNQPVIRESKPPEQVNREFTEWAAENRWYQEDAELQAMAEEFGELVKKNNPNLVGKQFLDEVTKRVKRAAPDKFQNPNRSNPAVSTSSDSRSTGASKGKKSYKDLPPEAKVACDRLVKEKLMPEKEAIEFYLKEYFSE